MVTSAPEHRFRNNGVRQKIAFRPAKDRVSYWYGINYEPKLFANDIKALIPDMRYTPSEGPPREPVPPKGQSLESSHGWNDWSGGWNSWYGRDWRHSEDDDETSSDPCAKRDTPKSELPPENNEPKETEISATTDAPKQAESPKVETSSQSSPPEPATEPAVSGTEQSPDVKDEPATLPPPEFNRYVEDPTPIDDVSDAPSHASRFQEEFRRLQVLSPEGPPSTLSRRYERQQIANRMSLDPLLYNLLVFGEMPPCQQH